MICVVEKINTMRQFREMTSTALPHTVLIGRQLSAFYVEKLEHPTGSTLLSEFPIRVWVIAPGTEDAVAIKVGPAGCSIQIETRKPQSVDMPEHDCRTLILPQFLDETLRANHITGTSIAPCDEGQKLTLQLSDGTELTFACHGDDELRPSIDQSVP